MARKRKKTQGTPSFGTTEPPASISPSDGDWQRTIDFFLVLRALGSAASRRRAEKLAEALEREALAVFRVARVLENGLPPVLDLKERAVQHGRASIVTKLRDFTRRLVDLAHLDTLDEQLGRSAASWYHQGGLLLDAAERTRANVAAYEYVDVQRPEGESGTVAWSYLTAHAAQWGASDGEVARRLADAGYAGTDRDLFHLKENVKKHRIRRAPRKSRRNRSKRAR